MPETYSDETNNKLDASGRAAIEPHAYHANLKRMRATIPYDGQASGDTIVLGELPVGAQFAYGVLNGKAGAGGTATIAIGTAADAAKYRAAAIFNTADTPTMFGKAVPAGSETDPLTAVERVIATIGAAALPTSADYLVVDIYYSSAAS